jgi:hypothetical protein
MAIVLVDGENVRRSRWPNVGREKLVELCCAWGAAASHRVVVVFDGGAPAVDARGACEVVGSGSESADEWLIREAPSLAATGPVWLVTSDRALREAAERNVERVIGGGAYLAELLGSSPKGGSQAPGKRDGGG